VGDHKVQQVHILPPLRLLFILPRVAAAEGEKAAEGGKAAEGEKADEGEKTAEGKKAGDGGKSSEKEKDGELRFRVTFFSR
jgi:hypothetical protein